VNRIRLITHEQKEILLVDCTACTAAEMLTLIDEVPRHVRNYPHGSLLLLGDFSNAEFNRDVVERLKVAAVFDRPHVKRSAWVLTANLPPVLYEAIKTFSGRDLPIFGTRNEALKYLVSESP
jgi:hypothetical protein